MNNIALHIEALIFAATQPVSKQDLEACISKMDENVVIASDEFDKIIKSIEEKYKSSNYPFELVFSGGGYQFLTKPDYHEIVALLLNQKQNKKLSSAALETLSIIAYKQPVTKSEIEQIRGVNADYTVHKLLEKELVTILGKADAPGRPVLYGVSEYFLDYFGINSIEELPQIKEIAPKDENAIGESEG